MNFESLVGCINQVQDVLQAQAAHAVNLSLTARNWLVGYYIVEFEQRGEDRAKYGDLPYLQENSKILTGSDAFPILQTLSAKLEEWCTPPEKLFYRLNFSNLSYF